MADLTMGQRIAEERKKLGISQEALGEKMGVSRQAISKWEADGAVPEIDKLIGLSKLFGVSVGWLLGVEEFSAPVEETREDTLSEKQLQIVEEIVKKYQSKQTKRTLQLQWLSIFAMLIILLASIYKFSVRVDSSQGNYGALTSQLNELRTQMQTIKNQSEAPTSLSLFGEYRFELEQLADAPGAQIRFSAMPNVWQEGDRGYLTITQKDMEPIRVDCTWNGAWFTADFPLEAADGYAFCMTILHSDGTQEQQILHDSSTEDLLSALYLTAHVTPGKVFYQNGSLTLQDFTAVVTMPGTGFIYGTQKWERVDFVLYKGDEEIGRFNLLLSNPPDDDEAMSPSIAITYPTIQFENIQEVVQLGDTIDLYIDARMTNGLKTLQFIDSWTLLQAGQIH